MMLPSSGHVQQGFSIIELLVVVVVSSLMVIALTLFVGRGFIVSREQFEQVRITEDARKELERISEVIRDAQFVEIDGSAGTDTNPLERNIQVAKSNELVMYANIDDDVAVEKVRYFLQGTELLRAFTEPTGTPPDELPDYNTGESAPLVLVRSVRNGTQSTAVPVFSYYTAGTGESGILPPDDNSASGLSAAQLSRLGRVRLRLIIDVNPQQNPTAADIFTEATPRSVLTPNCFGDDCPLPACSVEPDDRRPFEITDSAAISTAFTECASYCGQGCSAGVSFTADANFIYAYCACGSSNAPSGYDACVANPGAAGCVYEENVQAVNLTEFYRDCWDGTLLTNTLGEPYCNAPSGGVADCVCLP